MDSVAAYITMTNRASGLVIAVSTTFSIPTGFSFAGKEGSGRWKKPSLTDKALSELPEYSFDVDGFRLRGK